MPFQLAKQTKIRGLMVIWNQIRTNIESKLAQHHWSYHCILAALVFWGQIWLLKDVSKDKLGMDFNSRFPVSWQVWNPYCQKRWIKFEWIKGNNKNLLAKKIVFKHILDKWQKLKNLKIKIKWN